MNLKYRIRVILSYCCLSIGFTIFSYAPTHAQTITENKPLVFGKFVMANNNVQRTISLQPNGSYTADPNYIFFDEPQLATITVEDYLPLQPLTITVGTTTLSPSMGGGANFNVTGSFTIPEIILTDVNGTATFDVGASLISDGNGNTHSDSHYQGIYTISVTQ